MRECDETHQGVDGRFSNLYSKLLPTLQGSGPQNDDSCVCVCIVERPCTFQIKASTPRDAAGRIAFLLVLLLLPYCSYYCGLLINEFCLWAAILVYIPNRQKRDLIRTAPPKQSKLSRLKRANK